VKLENRNRSMERGMVDIVSASEGDYIQLSTRSMSVTWSVYFCRAG